VMAVRGLHLDQYLIGRSLRKTGIRYLNLNLRKKTMAEQLADKVNNALELQEYVKEFFNKYLNRVEESDSGHLFHPIGVSCCRALMLQPLGDLLDRMRVLSGADEDPINKMREE